MNKLVLLLTAALSLTISAHAHLGWTMEDCISHWGNYQQITDADGAPKYCFIDPASKLSIGCIFYQDHVEAISYISSNDYVVRNENRLLAANGSSWQLYDDGRGTQTISTWRMVDPQGQLAQYAILERLPNGYYRLSICTGGYGAWLNSLPKNRRQPDYGSDSQLINISYTFKNLSIDDLVRNDIDPRYVC